MGAIKRRWVRWILRSLLAVAVLVAACGGWVIYQHGYELRQEQVTITGGEQPLKGVLAWPTTGMGPYGLVVFVHGDDPIDATHDEFYLPLWEAFAQAGYASLSWNKPGVGGAAGNWLDQSMADRAAEAVAAITWAKGRPGLDPTRIGLWGASQAGWVMPKVAARLPELRFVIALSPAINWQQQGRYYLMAKLRDEHASPDRVRAELARQERMLALLRARVSYEQYKAAVGDTEMTAERWTFISKNYTSDAAQDLAAMRVPVLLLLAGHDRNVDVADTEAGYRGHLRAPGLLQVRHYPGASHAMIRKEIHDSESKMFLLAVAAPRSLFPDGFLDDQRRYLEQVS
ncbi:alpha/beta hydrolase [Spongiactinospora sp. TRM90649]|uniref:alpha/beta hydrolase family protein n=1 Tax=Spongiactinospora sp. TRM90649 TaxID=3031114 RepID=UPI0023F87548|nr:alpha/beta hydrolase [Spongiactinospora sp. TRM90649]MDF5754502.1 alpha/beta hydrolase [Spongiactinospora sp. TRM90649]